MNSNTIYTTGPILNINANITQNDFLQTYYDLYVGEKDNHKVVKKIIGNDQTNTYNMYEYDFKPKQYITTMLLTSSMHCDLASTFALARFMHDVMNDKTDELKYIHENIRIKVIPIVNVYGFNNSKQATNSNGVDIEKNFDYQNAWASISGSKGESIFSEQETKVLCKWILKNYSAMFWIDCQNNTNSVYTTNLSCLSDSALVENVRACVCELSRWHTQKYNATASTNINTSSNLKQKWAELMADTPTITLNQDCLHASFKTDNTSVNDGAISNYCSTLQALICSLLGPEIDIALTKESNFVEASDKVEFLEKQISNFKINNGIEDIGDVESGETGGLNGTGEAVNLSEYGAVANNNASGTTNYQALLTAVKTSKKVIIDDTYYIDLAGATVEQTECSNVKIDGVGKGKLIVQANGSWWSAWSYSGSAGGVFRLVNNCTGVVDIQNLTLDVVNPDGYYNMPRLVTGEGTNSYNLQYIRINNNHMLKPFCLLCLVVSGDQQSKLNYVYVEYNRWDKGHYELYETTKYYNNKTIMYPIEIFGQEYEYLLVKNNYMHNGFGLVDDNLNHTSPYRNKKVCDFLNNTMINDDGYHMYQGRSSMYHTFVISRCRKINFSGNRMEGLAIYTGDVDDTTYDVNSTATLYLAYLNAKDVLCENNIYKNNCHFRSFSGNTLLKNKAIEDGDSSATKIFRNNTFIVEYKWLKKTIELNSASGASNTIKTADDIKWCFDAYKIEFYKITSDTALDDTKTYYMLSGTTYTEVTTPSVANIATYHEKIYLYTLNNCTLNDSISTDATIKFYTTEDCTASTTLTAQGITTAGTVVDTVDTSYKFAYTLSDMAFDERSKLFEISNNNFRIEHYLKTNITCLAIDNTINNNKIEAYCITGALAELTRVRSTIYSTKYYQVSYNNNILYTFVEGTSGANVVAGTSLYANEDYDEIVENVEDVTLYTYTGVVYNAKDSSFDSLSVTNNTIVEIDCIDTDLLTRCSEYSTTGNTNNTDIAKDFNEIFALVAGMTYESDVNFNRIILKNNYINCHRFEYLFIFKYVVNPSSRTDRGGKMKILDVSDIFVNTSGNGLTFTPKMNYMHTGTGNSEFPTRKCCLIGYLYNVGNRNMEKLIVSNVIVDDLRDGVVNEGFTVNQITSKRYSGVYINNSVLDDNMSSILSRIVALES